MTSPMPSRRATRSTTSRRSSRRAAADSRHLRHREGRCASRVANFTNEAGVDGTVRYLRNVMGLWVLSETLRTWDVQGHRVELADLLAEAATLPSGGDRKS